MTMEKKNPEKQNKKTQGNRNEASLVYIVKSQTVLKSQ